MLFGYGECAAGSCHANPNAGSLKLSGTNNHAHCSKWKAAQSNGRGTAFNMTNTIAVQFENIKLDFPQQIGGPGCNDYAFTAISIVVMICGALTKSWMCFHCIVMQYFSIFKAKHWPSHCMMAASTERENNDPFPWPQ